MSVTFRWSSLHSDVIVFASSSYLFTSSVCRHVVGSPCLVSSLWVVPLYFSVLRIIGWWMFSLGMPLSTLRCLIYRDGSIYRRESVSGALCGDWSRRNVSWLETEWSAFVVMEHLIGDSISTWHLQDPSRSLFDCIVAPFWMNLQCSADWSFASSLLFSPSAMRPFVVRFVL